MDVGARVVLDAVLRQAVSGIRPLERLPCFFTIMNTPLDRSVGLGYVRDPLDHFVKEIILHYPPVEGAGVVRVLVLGCPPARAVQELLGRGFGVYVADEESEAVTTLRLAVGFEQPNFDTCCVALSAVGDIFPRGFFEVVLDAGCLQHVIYPQALRIYHTLSTLLRRGGRMMGWLGSRSSQPGPDWIGIAPGTYARHNGTGRHLWFLYDREGVANLLPGFDHVDIRETALAVEPSGGAPSIWLISAR